MVLQPSSFNARFTPDMFGALALAKQPELARFALADLDLSRLVGHAGAIQRPASPTSPLQPLESWPEGGEECEAARTSPAPRTAQHRRKAVHPHRAAEAVAEGGMPRAQPHIARSPAASPTPERHHHHHQSPRLRAEQRLHVLHNHLDRGVRKSPPRGSVVVGGFAGGNKECYSCHTQKTPMWRRVGEHNFCNACGLRKKRAESGR